VSIWRDVIERLARALGAGPGRAYLVGGAARDLLLGREPRDIDLLVEAAGASAETSVLAALADLSGMQPVVFDRRPPATHRVRIGEVQVDLSFCAPGGLAEALRRRDFTINAMAIPLSDLAGPIAAAEPDPDSGQRPAHGDAQAFARHMIDPSGGVADLRARRIAPASPGSLDEDPLRMLRAVRLTATLPDFEITADLVDQVRAHAARIAEAASERVEAELHLIFKTPRAGAAVRRMDELGLLAPLLPELEPLRGLRQPPKHHDHDAFEHTLRALEAADVLAAGCDAAGVGALSAENTVILKWAALLHDIGKAATATAGDDGAPHFYGHETVSAALAEEALRRLRVPSRIAAPVVALIDLHLRLGALAFAGVGDRPVRRVVRAAGDLLPALVLLSVADRRASGGESPSVKESALIEVCRRATALRGEVEAAAKAPPLLDGNAIMQILGLPPGPRVGSIARWLERLRSDGCITTRDDAVALLRNLPPSRIRD